jgi:hypothetical protein
VRGGALIGALPPAAVAAALVLGAVPVALHAAGNVTAAVTASGGLTIKGDTNGNGIHIQALGPFTYLVAGDGTTTVNGEADFTANGAAGAVRISMGGGDDQLFIEDTNAAPFLGLLTIRMGDGNDTLDMSDTEVSFHAKISTESGDDTVDIDASSFGRNLTIKTGDGLDVVAFESGTVSDRTTISTGADADTILSDLAQRFVGPALVRTASGDDSVTFADTTLHSELRINCSTGTDTADLSDPANTFMAATTLSGCEAP